MIIENNDAHSGELGKMEVKDPATLSDYYYDTHDKMFKKKNQPYGPGKTNLYPTDYGILCIMIIFVYLIRKIMQYQIGDTYHDVFCKIS